MDDNNKNINDPNKDNLDSTRKFNINDISRTLDNDGKVDNPSKATTNPSDFFKRGGSLVDSHSINEQESPKDVFDEIFDSQKRRPTRLKTRFWIYLFSQTRLILPYPNPKIKIQTHLRKLSFLPTSPFSATKSKKITILLRKFWKQTP